jgi:hypothetical protein
MGNREHLQDQDWVDLDCVCAPPCQPQSADDIVTHEHIEKTEMNGSSGQKQVQGEHLLFGGQFSTTLEVWQDKDALMFVKSTPSSQILLPLVR